VPHRIIACPGRAEFRIVFTGRSLSEFTFCTTAGPLPPWLIVKIPS